MDSSKGFLGLNKHSKFITGFRKLHGTQHTMVTVLEKWRKALDKKNISASYLWIYQRPLTQSIMIHLFFFISITTISVLRLKFLKKLSIL